MVSENKVLIEVVRGPEGDCLSVNDYRVAGPKPWGGGQVIRSWSTSEKIYLHPVRAAVERAVAEEASRIRQELLETKWPLIFGVNQSQHEKRLRAIIDRIVPE